jgi:hypothetical protein
MSLRTRIILGVVGSLVLLGAAGWALLATGLVTVNVAVKGPSVVVVKPSASPRPSPSPSSSPSPSPNALAGAPLSSAGTPFQTSNGTDPAGGRGNGPGCQIWVDAGWSLGDCGIIPIDGPDQQNGVAWVAEKNPSPGAWRVFLMTPRDDGPWQTELYAPEGDYTNISVKGAVLTPDGHTTLVVGFRHVGTAKSLSYDIVQRGNVHSSAPGHPYPLNVVGHRELVHGAAKLAAGGISDYSAVSPSEATKTVIRYSDDFFRIVSTSTIAGLPPTGDFA